MMDGHDQRKGRAAGLRLDKIQLYPSEKSHRWLKKRAKKKTEKKWGSTLKGVALGICTLLLAAMCLSVSQHAVTGCGELLGATVCGCGWQIGAPSTHRLVGTKRAVRYSVLRHVASHCNVLRQWKRPQTKKKKKREDRKEVALCSQMAKGVAEWCRKLQRVAVDSCKLQRVVACCSVVCIGTGGSWLSEIAVCCNALNWVASGADNMVSEGDICLGMSRWVEAYCNVPRHTITCHNMPKRNTWDMRNKSVAKRIRIKTGVLDITVTSVIGIFFTGVIDTISLNDSHSVRRRTAHNKSSQVCKVRIGTAGNKNSVAGICERKCEEKQSYENCNNSIYTNINGVETIMHKCRWDRDVGQEAHCTGVDRATCICAYICTAHTGRKGGGGMALARHSGPVGRPRIVAWTAPVLDVWGRANVAEGADHVGKNSSGGVGNTVGVESSCCSVSRCVAMCCSVLQCVAVCCSVLQCVTVCRSVLRCVAVCCSVVQRVAACCSVLQCVAVCCSVLQCVAVCCSVLQFVAV